MAPFSRFRRNEGLTHNSQPLLFSSRPEDAFQADSKEDPTISVDAVHSSGRPWTGTFWRFGAISGILAIATAIACLGVSLGVLIASDGDPVAYWTIQPAVFLSISETVCSTLLRYAFATSVPIVWWRHAVKGRTLASLEKEWAAGLSLSGAIRSGRDFGLVAFASVCCVLLLATGPLLQKASLVVQAQPPKPVDLTYWLSPEVPTDWSGTTEKGTWVLSEELNAAYSDFVRDAPIRFAVDGCEGDCEARIRAPGLAQSGDCATVTVPIDIQHLDKWPQSINNNWVLLRSKIGNDVLNHTWSGHRNFTQPKQHSIPDPRRETISIYTEYASVSNGTGSFIMSQCWYVSAVVEHTVAIRNDSSYTFVSPPADPRVVSLANNTIPVTLRAIGNNTDHNVTIGNLASVVVNYMEANLGFYRDGNSSSSGLIYFGRTLFSDQIVSMNSIYDFQGVDPKNVILAGFNEILFRGGIAVAANENYGTPRNIDKGLKTVQHTSANITSKISVFQTNYRWWAGATVIQLLCVVVILPLFWGWWTLGRPVTLSPFEVARAMEAPLLRDVDSNAGAEDIRWKLGAMRLRYGRVKGSIEDEGEDILEDKVSGLALRHESGVDPLRKR